MMPSAVVILSIHSFTSLFKFLTDYIEIDLSVAAFPGASIKCRDSHLYTPFQILIIIYVIVCIETDSSQKSMLLIQFVLHPLSPARVVYREICGEHLGGLFGQLSAKDRSILGYTYGVYGCEDYTTDELALKEMLTPDAAVKVRKAALRRDVLKKKFVLDYNIWKAYNFY